MIFTISLYLITLFVPLKRVDYHTLSYYKIQLRVPDQERTAGNLSGVS